MSIVKVSSVGCDAAIPGTCLSWVGQTLRGTDARRAARAAGWTRRLLRDLPGQDPGTNPTLKGDVCPPCAHVLDGRPAARSCGATDWTPCGDDPNGADDLPHVYAVCNRFPHPSSDPRQPSGRHTQTLADGTVWADWSGDSGPIPPGPWCNHTRDRQPPTNGASA